MDAFGGGDGCHVGIRGGNGMVLTRARGDCAPSCCTFNRGDAWNPEATEPRQAVKPVEPGKEREEAMEPDTGAICRICHDTSGKMFAVCRCSGSIKYVHLDCLEAMILRPYDFERRCGVCRTEYRVQFCPPTSCDSSILRWMRLNVKDSVNIGMLVFVSLTAIFLVQRIIMATINMYTDSLARCNDYHQLQEQLRKAAPTCQCLRRFGPLLDQQYAHLPFVTDCSMWASSVITTTIILVPTVILLIFVPLGYLLDAFVQKRKLYEDWRKVPKSLLPLESPIMCRSK